MNKIILIGCLLLTTSLFSYNNEKNLTIVREGNIITVVDFRKGDKIKLFDVTTEEHILSKTYGEIDLSLLPIGEYRIENSLGRSVIIQKLDSEIYVEEPLDDQYMVSERMQAGDVGETESDLIAYWIGLDAEVLEVEREGDLITILDFADGDKIKLFELESKIHVLTKKSFMVDLSQLPVGKYFLENNYGKVAVVEKFYVPESEEEIMVEE